MTDLTCDRSIILADILPEETLDNTYTWQGGAGRVSNNYRYEYDGDTNIEHVDEADKSMYEQLNTKH